MMKKLLLLLLLVPIISSGQRDIAGFIPNCLRSIQGIMTDNEFKKNLTQIADKNPSILDGDYFLIPCFDVSNFASIEFNGRKIILYNKLFFHLISKIVNTGKNFHENAWENPAIMFILFHEMGHFNHEDNKYENGGFSGTLSKNHSIEREKRADVFAAKKMHTLGFGVNDVIYFQSAINAYLLLSQGSEKSINNTHPEYSERVELIKKTYKNFKNLKK